MNKSKVYPVTDRVIIIPDPISEEKISGLIVPDDSKEKPNYATVYSTGPNCKQTKEGDRVIYPHKYGSNLKYDGQEMIIMKESDLWAVIGEQCGWDEVFSVFDSNEYAETLMAYIRANYNSPTKKLK